MIAPDTAQRIVQEQELIRAEFDDMKQQLAALDERQRNDKASMSRAFVLVDQAVADLRAQVAEDRKAGALQDEKLTRIETLLGTIRFWDMVGAGMIALGFIAVLIGLFVIALQR